MTHEEIIAMAREAGFRTGHINMSAVGPLPFVAPISATSCIVEVKRLIELAAARERERFALECIDLVAFHGGSVELEAAIRDRGTKEGA